MRTLLFTNKDLKAEAFYYNDFTIVERDLLHEGKMNAFGATDGEACFVDFGVWRVENGVLQCKMSKMKRWQDDMPSAQRDYQSYLARMIVE